MWLPNPGLRNSPMGPRNSFARHKLGMLPRRENLFALPIHGQSHFSDGKGVATILRHTGCDRTTHSLSMRSFSSRSRAGKDRHSGGWEKSRGASHRLGAGAGPGARCALHHRACSPGLGTEKHSTQYAKDTGRRVASSGCGSPNRFDVPITPWAICPTSGSDSRNCHRDQVRRNTRYSGGIDALHHVLVGRSGLDRAIDVHCPGID
jgi:hypothetical protein